MPFYFSPQMRSLARGGLFFLAALCFTHVYSCCLALAAEKSADADKVDKAERAVIIAETRRRNANVRLFEDLNGKLFGVTAGTVHDTMLEKNLDYTKFAYFEDWDAQIQALKDGEIDALIGDEPVLRYLTEIDPEVRVLDDVIEYEDSASYGMALNYSAPDLYEKVNSILKDLREEGLLAKLSDKWVLGPLSGKIMPSVSKANPGKTLVLGTNTTSPPFTYRDDSNRIIGFDIELVQEIAKRLGYGLEIVDMNFSSLIPNLVDGKIDIIASCLSITKEREKLVHFTDGYYECAVGALLLR